MTNWFAQACFEQLFCIVTVEMACLQVLPTIKAESQSYSLGLCVQQASEGRFCYI